MGLLRAYAYMVPEMRSSWFRWLAYAISSATRSLWSHRSHDPRALPRDFDRDGLIAFGGKDKAGVQALLVLAHDRLGICEQ